MKPEDGETADLFSDELFQRSQTWKLSTSGLSAGYQFRGTGFGTVYPDGYGINCEWWFMFSRFSRDIRNVTDANGICLCFFFKDLAGPDLIKFGIESKKSCKETSTEAFIDAIDLALHDMRDICVEGPSPPQLTARL